MTWSARVTDKDGNIPEGTWQACQKCKHGVTTLEGRGYHPPCYIPGAASGIANVLTAIDFGADNHMASGEALLKCNGFEPIETAEVAPSSDTI